MKSFLYTFLLLFPLILSGQISLDQSDMPEPGDTIRRSSTVGLGLLDFEETGPDFTWDFSSLIPLSQTVDTFVSVSETPFIYQILFFLTANLAQQQAEFDQFPGFELTDSYRYFKNSSSGFKEVGFGVSINSIPLPTLYENPDMIYKFPMEAGDIDSSLSTYDFSIPGLGYYGGWKRRKNTVDGWGTLSTPYGTFETLRLKSEILQYDSLFIDSLGIGMPFYQEYTEYKWLGLNMGIPLCAVTDNGIIQTVTYIDSVRTIFTGIGSTILENSIHLFPNPASERVHVSWDMPYNKSTRLDLMNMRGEIVYSIDGLRPKERLTIHLNRQNISSGLYILMLHCNGQVKSKKLMVY